MVSQERPPGQAARLRARRNRALLKDLRAYLDPQECGAFLCICGNRDDDPCPLHRFLARLDKAVTP